MRDDLGAKWRVSNDRGTCEVRTAVTVPQTRRPRRERREWPACQFGDGSQVGYAQTCCAARPAYAGAWRST
jgi:hypothetical protein